MLKSDLDGLTRKHINVANLLIHVDSPVHDFENTCSLSTINARNDAPDGTGTAIMKEICAIADKHGALVTCTPGEQRGSKGYKNTTSISRLHDFYRRFGFVKNSSSRDYRPDLHGTWHRYPKETSRHLQLGS